MTMILTILDRMISRCGTLGRGDRGWRGRRPTFGLANFMSHVFNE